MFRIVVIVMALTVLFCGEVQADLSGEFYRFKPLFENSISIVEGVVVEKEYLGSGKRNITFAIKEYYGGTALGDTISFVHDYLGCDFCFRFDLNESYIVFVVNKDDGLVVTGNGSGAFELASKEDICLLTEAFKEHPDMFTPSKSDVLKDSLFKLTEQDSQWRLMQDFIGEPELIGDDPEFIITLIESGYPNALYIAYSTALPSMLPYMEYLLQSTDNSSVQSGCIRYLGEVLDPRSIPLILAFVGHEDASLRISSCFVLGKYCLTGHDCFVEKFRERYFLEDDISMRSILLTAITRSQNSAQVLEILTELVVYEPVDWMRDSINREIAKLELVSVEKEDITQYISTFPNPANPNTTITFSIEHAGNVTLNVYNLSGQRVSTLVDSFLSAGNHSAVFDGRGLSSGIYLYRLESEGFTKNGKFTLLR